MCAEAASEGQERAIKELKTLCSCIELLSGHSEQESPAELTSQLKEMKRPHRSRQARKEQEHVNECNTDHHTGERVQPNPKLQPSDKSKTEKRIHSCAPPLSPCHCFCDQQEVSR